MADTGADSGWPTRFHYLLHGGVNITAACRLQFVQSGAPAGSSGPLRSTVEPEPGVAIQPSSFRIDSIRAFNLLVISKRLLGLGGGELNALVMDCDSPP